MATADEKQRRDAGWILGEALRLADEIWENEDRNVEHLPGYDAEVTVNAAVELAGAVKALDGLLENGYPLPHSWRKLQGAVADGDVRLAPWRVVGVRPVANLLRWCERRLPGGIRVRLGKTIRPWMWKRR
jgi:hypothetical protein